MSISPASEDSQREVIEALSRPETYGLEHDRVERHDTHGAIVFLAGPRAYKLKRAVHLAYMDYSTRERRKDMCERELVVNRRTAPQLYLGVEAVIRDGHGKIRLGTRNEGDVLDWVVVMRRFAEEDLLEQMRQKGRLTLPLMDRLAETIAHFHETAERNREHGGWEGIAAVVAENDGVLRSLAGQPFDLEDIERFFAASNGLLERCRRLLEDRRTDGHVRRCHGDLHLNNICLIGGSPVLFDAIEFNDSFAVIDVFYDLAFLIMDLDRHGLRAHGNRLFNRYLECTFDHAGTALLPLFLSCRAAIRAHVAAETAKVAKTNQEMTLKDALKLLGLAISYAQPRSPRLVAIGGVSGTGKSTLARRLAPRMEGAPGAVILRSDVIRKHLMGVAEATRLPEAAYGAEVTSRVYAAIAALALSGLSGGHSVIADAVYGTTEERRQIERVAQEAGVRFDGLWLEADLAILEERISARTGDASDATIAVARRQLGFVERPAHWRVLDARAAPEAIAESAARALGLSPSASLSG